MPKSRTLIALIALLAIAPALTGCPDDIAGPGNGTGGGQNGNGNGQNGNGQNGGSGGNGGGGETVYRTPDIMGALNAGPGRTIALSDHTLLGTQPVGTTGLMTAELRGRLQAAVDAALAGQNEEAERRWNHVLARNIGIEVRDGAADGVRAVNRQTLAVYIDWLKTQTPETLVAMLDATVREPLYRMAPEMFPWEERTFTKTITVRNLQVMEEREFSLVDRTRAGEKVDIDGLDANGIKVEGMVTPAIRAKFNDAIKIMEENLARDSLYNGQTRQVLNRGFKVILVNDPAYFQNGKFEWNAATLHIGEISASSVENLSRDLIAIITQLIFPLPEPPAE